MKPVTRQQFLQQGFSKSLMMAMSGAATSIHQAHSQSFSDAKNIADMLAFDPVTLSYPVFGSCCWYCPSNLIVSHFQPVYYIEVLRSENDSSIFPNERLSNPNRRTVVLSVSYHAFEARTFELPTWVIDMAAGSQSCKPCGKRYVPRHPSQQRSNTCSSGALLSKAIEGVNDALSECIPKLVCDSTLALVAWRTRCNDAHRLSTYAAAAECLASSSHFNEDCLGKWDAKYPRQMAKIDSDSRMGAVVAVLRALSIADAIAEFGEHHFPPGLMLINTKKHIDTPGVREALAELRIPVEALRSRQKGLHEDV